MKWSAATAEEVPVVLVTRMSTWPAVCDGEVMVSEVSEVMERLVPAVPPKVTDVAVRKPVPVTVTTVPPVAFPNAGLTAVTLGVVS